MRFKYITRVSGKFGSLTVDAVNEEDAWDQVVACRNPSETGLLIPMKEWWRLVQRNGVQGQGRPRIETEWEPLGISRGEFRR